MHLDKIYSTLILLILLSIFGCKSLFELPLDADSAYESKQYAVATKLLIEKYEGEKDLLEQSKIAYKIAESFRLSNNTINAEKWYENALQFSSEPLLNYQYAQMLMSNGKYKDAIAMLKEYSLNNPSDRTRAVRTIQACKKAMEWLEEPTEHKAVNIASLNTPFIDYAPVLYGTDQLVFTSSREAATGNNDYGWTGEKHSDLFSANIDGELRFSNIQLFGDSINTEYNEGTAAFNGDFTEVYFSACGSPGDNDDFCEIYFTRKNQDSIWLEPERLDLFPEEQKTVNVGQPYLTPDGKHLYFAADPSSSYGNKDIYIISKTRDGLWSDPKNLGPEINTDGYDGFPFIAADGKLYFASNGHMGMGGLDIFVADRKGKKWVNPTNLKHPINSPADDFGIFIEPFIQPDLMDQYELLGYLCSSRTGGKGKDDIYRLSLEVPQEPEIDTTVIVDKPPVETKPKEPIYLLQGTVYQRVLEDINNQQSPLVNGGALREAVVQILGTSANSSLAARVISDEKGEFRIELEKNSDYKLSATKNGYFTNTATTSTKGREVEGVDTIYINTDIILDKIYQRKEIVLENIYYDLDSSVIREDAQPTLNKLATLLFENPSITIELGSHTDARGSDKYNLSLSQDRAQSAVNYLISRGISQSRLIAKGYGETQLVNDCKNGIECPDEKHEQNRRTTFQVLSNN